MSKERRRLHSTYPLYLFVVGIHTKETSNFVRSAEGACVCNQRPSGANNCIWLFVISCVLCTCCLYTCMLLYNETKKAILFGHQGSAELTSSAVVGEQGLKTNLNVN